MPIAVVVAPLWIADGITRHLDWATHLAWLSGFAHALGDGVVAPRWIASAHGGLGAPIFDLYPPLAYYIGAIPVLLGAGPETGLKFVYTVALFVLGRGVARWLRPVASTRAAEAGAWLAILSPIGALYIYRFNMPAGLLGIAIAPFAFAAANALLEAPRGPARRTALARLAATFAALLFGHHLTAAMVGVVLLAQAAVVQAVSRRAHPSGGRAAPPEKRWTCSGSLRASSFAVIVAALALGTAMAAHYLIPAIAMTPSVDAAAARTGAWDWRIHQLFVEPARARAGLQLLYPMFERGVELGTCIAALALAIVCIGASIRKVDVARTIVGCVVALAIPGVLASPLGGLAFAAFPPLAVLQFPWRALPIAWLALVVLVVLAAGAPYGGRMRVAARAIARVPLAAVVVATIAVLPILQGLRPGYGIGPLEWATPGEIERIVATGGETPPEYRPQGRQGFASRARAVDLIESRPRRVASDEFAFEVASGRARRVALPLAAFPGWQASIAGVSVPIDLTGADRLLRVDLPAGFHTLHVARALTAPQVAGMLVSFGAMLVALALALARPARRRAPG